MGVDAEMLVRTKSEVTEEKLRYWSYLFGSAYHDHLMLGFRNEIYHRPIELLESQEYPNKASEDKSPDETDLHIPLSGRYYGKGYERGPLMTYISMADFLEDLIPQSRIFYGGDSGDYLFPFDTQVRFELRRYFIENMGRDRYNRYFDKENDGPDCPVCRVKMIRCGWGGGGKYKSFQCAGCGWNHTEDDGVIKAGWGE